MLYHLLKIWIKTFQFSHCELQSESWLSFRCTMFQYYVQFLPPITPVFLWHPSLSLWKTHSPFSSFLLGTVVAVLLLIVSCKSLYQLSEHNPLLVWPLPFIIVIVVLSLTYPLSSPIGRFLLRASSPALCFYSHHHSETWTKSLSKLYLPDLSTSSSPILFDSPSFTWPHQQAFHTTLRILSIRVTLKIVINIERHSSNMEGTCQTLQRN